MEFEASFLRRFDYDAGAVLDAVERAGIEHFYFMHYSWKYDEVVFHKPDPVYYQNTKVRLSYSRRLPPDLLLQFCREGERRGIKIGVFFFPVRGKVRGLVGRGYEEIQCLDYRGRPWRLVCFNNPDLINHWKGAVRDVFMNYPVTGALYGSECGGPLFMYLRFREAFLPTCFCPHCQSYAKERGWDPERAREGFGELVQLFGMERVDGPGAAKNLFNNPRAERPMDGYFVSFLRILFRYPEILFWHRMWYEHQLNLQRILYETAKEIDPDLFIGQHMWNRGRTFSPLMRADEDYDELVGVSDFIRPATWTQPAGMRYLEEVASLRATWLGDWDIETICGVLYQINGWPHQGSPAEIRNRPFDADFFASEVRMAMERINGRAKTLTGIGVNDYGNWTSRRLSHERVKADIRASRDVGADGIMFHTPLTEERFIHSIREGLSDVGWT